MDSMCVVVRVPAPTRLCASQTRRGRDFSEGGSSSLSRNAWNTVGWDSDPTLSFWERTDLIWIAYSACRERSWAMSGFVARTNQLGRRSNIGSRRGNCLILVLSEREKQYKRVAVREELTYESIRMVCARSRNTWGKNLPFPAHSWGSKNNIP